MSTETRLGCESAYPYLDLNQHAGLQNREVGLTKRELFAMTLLNGLIAHGEWDDQWELAAETAVRGADTLLKELAK